MKALNIKLLFAFFAVTILLSGCKKDENELSRPTYLPDLAIKGDFNYVILAGDEYEEPGATATVNGTPIDYTIAGTVDASEPGLYILTYTATNSDGFSASATRNVFVLPEPYNPEAANISGDYKRAANGRASKVTTVVDGVYLMSDGWGSASSGGQPLPVPCYLMCTNGVDILMPNYPTVFGGMEGEGTYDGTKMSIYTILVDQGPFARTNVWNKQ
ncbi:MAG TPA: DUF5011 domain-containing protein [Chitinophagales bacterium]|mgnify:FL=1|nr:DUF5011 domain-containing protein [Chitinophagales bacterium]HQO32240.1 DUF5011 domain-containing protein [Chitinophagales bacterium]HQO89601.1 DUF5011 domain-containing protein [Chitinophagales bacterium]